MTWIAIIFGGVFLLTFLAVISGMTLHDIRLVRLNKQFRSHPHARKWRKRPLVSIIISGNPSNDCLASIRRSNYRKLQVVGDGEIIKGELILTLTPDTVLEKTAISQAVRELNARPDLSLVELLTSVRKPRTTGQLFAAYRHISSAPFVAARAGLDIVLPHSSWPTIVRTDSYKLTNRTRIYLVARFFVQLTNIVTLVYAGYLALTLHQPEFLLAYLAAFCLWLAWSIISYRHFSYEQKIMYLMLAPASFISFLYRCLTAPLHLRQYAALLPPRRRSGIIAIIEI